MAQKIFLLQFLFITILCAEMSGENKARTLSDFNFVILFRFALFSLSIQKHSTFPTRSEKDKTSKRDEFHSNKRGKDENICGKKKKKNRFQRR